MHKLALLKAMQEIPEWDNTREFNWKHIAETIRDNLNETELKPLQL